MTGDDSYHAHCFNCKVCKKRIEELVFAKTSQGIYCMPCHTERVARSKRHLERKERERKERERQAEMAAAAAYEQMQQQNAAGKEGTNASAGANGVSRNNNLAIEITVLRHGSDTLLRPRPPHRAPVRLLLHTKQAPRQLPRRLRVLARPEAQSLGPLSPRRR